MKRVRKVLSLLFATLVLFVALVMTALWWLTSTEAGVAWGLARVDAMLGERLQLEGVRGIPAEGLSIAQLSYEDEGLRLEAQEVQLRTALLPLLRLQLHIEQLGAREVAVQLKETEAEDTEERTPPGSLRLPLSVRLENGRIDTLTFRQADAGAPVYTVRDIALRYAGGPLGHQFEHFALRTDYGDLQLTGHIGAARPFPIEGELRLSRSTAPLPLSAQLQLDGSLERLKAALRAESEGAQAQATALLAPFDERWLESARLTAEGVDLRRFEAAWPLTELALSLTAAAVDDAPGVRGMLEIQNTNAGPLDQERVPVQAVSARFDTDFAELQLADLQIDIHAGGTLAGQGQLRADEAQLQLQAQALDLRQLYSTLRQTQLSGPLDLVATETRQSLHGTLRQDDFTITASATRTGERIDVPELSAKASGGSLQGSGHIELNEALPFAATLRFAGFDPSRFGDFPTGSLNGDAQADGQLQADRRRLDLRWQIADSRLRDEALASTGRLRLEEQRLSQVEAQARWGRATARAAGAFGQRGDVLQWQLQTPRLELLDERLAGRLEGSGRLQGLWQTPRLAFDLQGRALQLPGNARFATLAASGEAGLGSKAPLSLQLRATGMSVQDVRFEQLRLTASGSMEAHTATLSGLAPDVDLQARLAGGWSERQGWTGRIESLRNEGRYPLVLTASAPLRINTDQAALGRFDARLADGHLLVRNVDWREGRLSTSGEFAGLPAAWLIYAGGLREQLEASLQLNGDWSIVASPALSGHLSVSRASGDLVMQSAPAIAMALTRLDLNARFYPAGMTARLDLNSAIANAQVEARLQTVTRNGEALLTADSPLSLSARIDVGQLRAMSVLFATTGRVDGSLQAQLQADGTLRAPALSGMLRGDDLSFETPPYGIYLKDGQLRATLQDDILTVDEFVLHGGRGRLTVDGRLPLRMAEGGADLRWRAERLSLMSRPDMRLVISGDGGVRFDGDNLAVQGELLANSGYFELGDTALPELGDDVVVVGSPRDVARPKGELPFALDLRLNLGRDLEMHAYGYHGFLNGRLHLTTSSAGQLQAQGRIRTERGRFTAYGQELTVEEGTLIFSGPVDNPVLDVEAWRRNQAVEVGVVLSGTVERPQAVLVSEPPVSEGEKLSWLVLGRAPDDAQGADLALLQAAAGTLFGRGDAVGINQQIARKLGLDDLSLRGSGQLTGNVVAVGKRFSDNIYITLEQGLGLAQNLVKVDYSLSRRWSARLETGTTSGLGLFYRIAFD